MASNAINLSVLSFYKKSEIDGFNNNIITHKYMEFNSVLDFLEKQNSLPKGPSLTVYNKFNSLNDTGVSPRDMIHSKNYTNIKTSLLSEREFLKSITKKILSSKDLYKFWKLQRKSLGKGKRIYYFFFEITNKIYLIHSSEIKDLKNVYRFIEEKLPLFSKKYGLKVKLLTNDLARIY